MRNKPYGLEKSAEFHTHPCQYDRMPATFSRESPTKRMPHLSPPVGTRSRDALRPLGPLHLDRGGWPGAHFKGGVTTAAFPPAPAARISALTL